MDTLSNLAAGAATSGNSSTALTPSAPGNAITGGYEGTSFAVRALIVFFSGLTLYNAVELIILVFFTFSKYGGLYFWSLIVSSTCCIPYALGFLFKLNNITTGNGRWLAVTFITIGWYGMVTGQSVVLWSRLHLLMDPGEKGQRLLRYTKWMIIIDAIVLHIPTTVLTYGSNGEIHTHTFVTGYNVMEKIQMCGFFLQEVILSALYIMQAAKLLNHSVRADAKKFFIQLVGINIIIITMDIGLLSTEAASLYLYETIVKGTIYSIKLKLEFAILGKLVNFVGGRQGSHNGNEERWRKASAAYVGENEDLEMKMGGRSPSTANGTIKGFNSDGDGGDNVTDFVDMTRVRTDMSHATHHSAVRRLSTDGMSTATSARQGKKRGPKTGRGVTDEDVDLARFQHVEGASLPDIDGDLTESELDDKEFRHGSADRMV